VPVFGPGEAKSFCDTLRAVRHIGGPGTPPKPTERSGALAAGQRRSICAVAFKWDEITTCVVHSF
jgi:hypothetical protein